MSSQECTSGQEGARAKRALRWHKAAVWHGMVKWAPSNQKGNKWPNWPRELLAVRRALSSEEGISGWEDVRIRRQECVKPRWHHAARIAVSGHDGTKMNQTAGRALSQTRALSSQNVLKDQKRDVQAEDTT